MRVSRRGRIGAAALYLFFALGMGACSSSPSEEEGLEASDNGNAETANAEEGGNGEATNEEATGEETADEQGAAETNGAEEVTNEETAGEAVAEQGTTNGTESDLQEIIGEANAAQPAEAVQMNAPVNQQQAANAAAPVNTQAGTPVSSGAAPAAASGVPALPEMGSKMPYIVQSGDTLGKIAQKIFGDQNRWNELAQLSGLSNPSKIYPGDLVYFTLDQSSMAFATALNSIQRSAESVKQGDTLFTIAQRVYGDAREWKAIWRENDQIENPDRLESGSTVYYVQKGAVSAAIKTLQKTTVAKATSHSTINSNSVEITTINSANVLNSTVNFDSVSSPVIFAAQVANI